MGMLRTEKSPRRVEGIWSEPPSELLESFHTPSDEDKAWAREQIKKLEAHADSQRPESPPSSPTRDSKYHHHPKYFHPKMQFQHPKFSLPRFFRDGPPMPPPKRSPQCSRTQRLLSCYRSILSPVRRVPDEIWQAIFMELFEVETAPSQILPAYQGGVFQHEAAYLPNSVRTRLLVVCRRWRSILLGTPDVWAPISLTYIGAPPDDNEKHELPAVDVKSPAYLQWVCKHTPDFPLSIDIKPDMRPDDTPPYVAGVLPKQLLQVAKSSAPRWGTLKLLVLHAPVIWNPSTCLPNTLPALQTLNLDFSHLEVREEEAIAALPSAPSLKHLNILNLINIWKMPEASVRYTSITHLQVTMGFQQPAARFEVAYINSLPNLSHFHFNGVLRWMETADHPPPIAFPQVKVLSLDSTEDTMAYILARLTMPNLHYLRIRIKLQLATPDAQRSSFQNELIQFIERSECKIKHLVLVDLHTSCLTPLLPSFGQVERLEMFMPRHMFDQTTKAINAMMLQLVWNPEASVPALPELRKLYLSFREDERFRNQGFTMQPGDVDIGVIVAVCETRVRAPSEEMAVKAARLEELHLNFADHRKLTPLEHLRLQDVRLSAKERTGKELKMLVRQGGDEFHEQMKVEENIPW